MPERNWAGNLTYAVANVEAPDSVSEIQEIVRRSHHVRTLGTRHSFNDIADTTGTLISLARLDQVVRLDAAGSTVTIMGGVRYGQLGEYLHARGYALRNMASLPHISVAGACATATHGSGVRHGNLATAVSAIELVTSDGELDALSRVTHGEEFDGMVVSLGALGVVTQLTLDVVPTFLMRQDVYANLSLASAVAHFDEIQQMAYSVSLFTDWTSGRFTQVWLKREVDADTPVAAPRALFGATSATADLHPLPGLSAQSCTAQMGVPGPWCDRLPHFRMEFIPSHGAELQSEYVIPYQHAGDAFQAMMRIGAAIAPTLLVSEVRTIAADSLWMSPCYQSPSVAIHFTWKPDWTAVRRVLPLIESALAPFAPRPHWGKLFTMFPDEVRSRHERLPDFRRLVEEHDPVGKFSNAFVDRYVFGTPVSSLYLDKM
ncbi:FAD-binding protein [soil metagenome]